MKYLQIRYILEHVYENTCFRCVTYGLVKFQQLLNVKMLILFIFRISILSEGFETSAQQFGSGKLSRWLNFCQSIFTLLSIHFIFLSIHSYISVNPFIHFCQSSLIFLSIYSYISVNPFIHFCRSILRFFNPFFTIY
jgi:hypothetical protein